MRILSTLVLILITALAYAGGSTGNFAVTGTITCSDIDPLGGDNTGNIGGPTDRFANIYGVNIEAGDIGFKNGWRITEDWENGGLILLSPEGKRYKFILEEIE